MSNRQSINKTIYDYTDFGFYLIIGIMITSYGLNIFGLVSTEQMFSISIISIALLIGASGIAVAYIGLRAAGKTNQSR